jgi:hypothetical protein
VGERLYLAEHEGRGDAAAARDSRRAAVLPAARAAGTLKPAINRGEFHGRTYLCPDINCSERAE